MPRQLPDEWVKGTKRSLNVAVDLGLRGVPAGNLSIYKAPPSKNCKTLFCRWLPPEEEDSRPFQGRTNGGKGKRKYLEGTTGHEDPFLAGKAAITWCKEQRQFLQQLGIEKDYQAEHSLHHYWDIWFASFQQKANKSKKQRRDQLNRWQGEGWGIGQQEWSHKSIDKINALDLQGYFQLLDDRGSGASQKEGQRTLLNHLWATALHDFPQLPKFIYPKIKRSNEEVENFTKQEWEKIGKKVIELSGGVANTTLTKQEYMALEFNPSNRCCERNWVDFYDCLMMMWFFFLRAEDMPRLRSEWFMQRDGKITLYLKRTKADRSKHETFPFRPDGHRVTKRILERKPKGYLSFPHYQRKDWEEQDSRVVKTLNFLLKKVVSMCGIEKRKVTWTVVRHTAFMLTLQDMPELGRQEYFRTFADNGHTGDDMLRDNYVAKTRRREVAEKAQEQIPPSSWTLVKRVSLD